MRTPYDDIKHLCRALQVINCYYRGALYWLTFISMIIRLIFRSTLMVHSPLCYPTLS